MFQLFDLVGKIFDFRQSLRRMRELREQRRAAGGEAKGAPASAEGPEPDNG
jgi:hypothetical protein